MKTLLLVINLGMILMWIGAITTFAWFLITEWEKLNKWERSFFGVAIGVVYIAGLTL